MCVYMFDTKTALDAFLEYFEALVENMFHHDHSAQQSVRSVEQCVGSERAFYGQGCYFAELAQYLDAERRAEQSQAKQLMATDSD